MEISVGLEGYMPDDQDITLEDAYKTLELGPEATVAEVHRSFRELSRKYHPDASKDDGRQQTKLNRARDLLIRREDNRQLITITVKREIQQIEKAISSQQSAAQLTDFVSATKRRRTQRVQAIKYSAILLAAICAGVGWLNDGDFSVFMFAYFRSYAYLGRELTYWLGGLAGLLQLFVAHQNFLVESEKERLVDEDYCFWQLEKIGGEGLQKPEGFTARELRSNFRSDLFDFPTDTFSRRMISFYLAPFRLFFLRPEERVRMTLLKALEHGIIENIPNSKRVFRMSTEFEREQS
jgi:DnaJ domain